MLLSSVIQIEGVQILKFMDPEICYAQVRTSVPGMKLADLELKAAHV